MTKFVYIELYTNPIDHSGEKRLAKTIHAEIEAEIGRLYKKHNLKDLKEIYTLDSEKLLDVVAIIVNKVVLVEVLAFLINNYNFSDMAICEIDNTKYQSTNLFNPKETDGLPPPDEDSSEDGSDADWWKKK